MCRLRREVRHDVAQPQHLCKQQPGFFYGHSGVQSELVFCLLCWFEATHARLQRRHVHTMLRHKFVSRCVQRRWKRSMLMLRHVSL